jgi:outer membrane protein assembly factor BamB
MFLATGREKGNEFLAALSTEDGKMIWRKNVGSSGISIFSHHCFDEVLLFEGYSEQGIFQLRLNDGTINAFSDLNIDNIRGLDSHYFVVGSSEENSVKHGVVYYGDASNTNPTPILRIDHLPCDDPESWFGCSSVWNAFPFHKGNDVYLLVNYEKHHPDYNTTAYAGLYNFTARQWVWKDTEVHPASMVSRLQRDPVIKDGFIYQVNDGISCINLETGKVVWRYRGTEALNMTGVVVYKDLVLAVTTNSVIAVNKMTGTLRWSTEAYDLPSDFIVHNGIVYFVSGGLLYAVDLDNLKLLWKMESPDMKLGRGNFFRSEISFIERPSDKKMLLITHTYRGVHAYETIR